MSLNKRAPTPDERSAPADEAGARPEGLLTTGEMARRSRTTVRTVRFYEETGVLEPASRSDGGHRLFAASELDKLKFVSALREVGLSLEEIKLLLAMKANQGCGAAAAREVTQVLARHLRALDEKIELLTQVRAQFEQATGRLGACADCHDEPRFPHDCGDCKAMQGTLPLSVRVLWSVEPAGTEKP